VLVKKVFQEENMKKSVLLVLAMVVISALLLAACGGGAAEAPAAAERPAVADAYKGKTNPFAGDAAAAEKGKESYALYCASCHGDGGKGDGPAGSALDPKPADLTTLTDVGDDFVFWYIEEGGVGVGTNSAMPAQKGVLSEDQVWEIVTFVRTLK